MVYSIGRGPESAVIRPVDRRIARLQTMTGICDEWPRFIPTFLFSILEVVALQCNLAGKSFSFFLSRVYSAQVFVGVWIMSVNLCL